MHSEQAPRPGRPISPGGMGQARWSGAALHPGKPGLSALLEEPRAVLPPRLDRQARSRRRVLWALCYFALAQLMGGLLFDYVWPEVKFLSLAVCMHRLRGYPQSPEIISLGSSRFGAGIEPAVIQPLVSDPEHPTMVFNASLEAGDLVTADYLLQHMLAGGIRPRLLIVEVSPETLAMRNEWLGQHVRRQISWGEVPYYFPDICRSGNLVRLISARCLPLHVHRQQICRSAGDYWLELVRPAPAARPARGKKQPQPLENKGVPWETFMKMNGPPEPPIRTQQGLPNVRRWLKNYEAGGTARAALDRLLDQCAAHDIAVVLVGVPVAEAHRELYTAEIDRAFLLTMTEACQRYGCRFVDYRDQVPDKLFLDNHHLLHEGGVYLSERLAREVLGPVWRDLRRADTARHHSASDR